MDLPKIGLASHQDLKNLNPIIDIQTDKVSIL